MSGSIPTDLTSEVAEQISAVSRRLRANWGARLPDLGMTHARMRALWRLGKADGPVRMGELAGALGIVPRSVTSVVDELAEAGLVARVPDPDDRRATQVEVTEAGRRVLADIEVMRAEAAAEVLGMMNDDDLHALQVLLASVLESPQSRICR